ncbi:hypothetical protein JCM5350_006682 [Sporobolomyces pararoseus]
MPAPAVAGQHSTVPAASVTASQNEPPSSTNPLSPQIIYCPRPNRNIRFFPRDDGDDTLEQWRNLNPDRKGKIEKTQMKRFSTNGIIGLEERQNALIEFRDMLDNGMEPTMENEGARIYIDRVSTDLLRLGGVIVAGTGQLEEVKVWRRWMYCEDQTRGEQGSNMVHRRAGDSKPRQIEKTRRRNGISSTQFHQEDKFDNGSSAIGPTNHSTSISSPSRRLTPSLKSISELGNGASWSQFQTHMERIGENDVKTIVDPARTTNSAKVAANKLPFKPTKTSAQSQVHQLKKPNLVGDSGQSEQGGSERSRKAFWEQAEPVTSRWQRLVSEHEDSKQQRLVNYQIGSERGKFLEKGVVLSEVEIRSRLHLDDEPPHLDQVDDELEQIGVQHGEFETVEKIGVDFELEAEASPEAVVKPMTDQQTSIVPIKRCREEEDESVHQHSKPPNKPLNELRDHSPAKKQKKSISEKQKKEKKQRPVKMKGAVSSVQKGESKKREILRYFNDAVQRDTILSPNCRQPNSFTLLAGLQLQEKGLIDWPRMISTYQRMATSSAARASPWMNTATKQTGHILGHTRTLDGMDKMFNFVPTQSKRDNSRRRWVITVRDEKLLRKFWEARGWRWGVGS